MSTKVIILSHLEDSNISTPKKIEFTTLIWGKHQKDNCIPTRQPNYYDVIELIARKGHIDLMYAYRNFEGRDTGRLYEGHFNSGIV